MLFTLIIGACASVAFAAIPAIKPTVGAYSYVGCFTEATGKRALSASASFNFTSMTLEMCASSCGTSTFFGVEYGGECYCGPSLNKGSVLAKDADCSFPCPGNKLEYCGAGWRLTLYKLSALATNGQRVSSSSSSSVSTLSATSQTSSVSTSSATSQTSSVSTPSATSQSSSPLNVSTSTPVFNSGKRGLPFNNPSTYIQQWSTTGSKVSWAYNWDSYMDSTFPTSTLEYVPMIWGTQDIHTVHWATDVATAQHWGSTHMLAFNEPDGCGWGQACMTPQDAVVAWNKYMQPYASTFSLGAPAITNGPAGMPWMKSFLSLCTGCKIDFVPLHWYDSATNVAYFKNYLADATAAYGNKPLWITEFNGAGTTAQQTTFLQTVIPWLDATSYIQRYAWQWCDPAFTGGTLVLASGQPSALGMTYGFM